MKLSKYKNRNKIFQGVIIIVIIFGIFALISSLTNNTSTDRRDIVTELHNALGSNDYKKAAFLNSILAQEAFQRAYKTLKAWEDVRYSGTDLVPTDLSEYKNVWLSKDSAADMFPFLLIASKLLNEENEKLWLNALANEREICGPMPCDIRLHPTGVVKSSLPVQIFGASEYAKDGLLAVTERFGKGPWYDRLEEIMQAIIKAAFIETRYGKISSASSEVNGEMLQVLSRLYWATENPVYLQMAEKIADAYLFEILPNNHYLPPERWKFKDKQPSSSKVKLKDHGSEIIPGLVELYFLEKVQGKNKAKHYRKEIKKLLDNILITGRTKEGLWYNSVDNTTKKPINKKIVDTWGYILNAYKMFDIAEGTSIYTDEIKRSMRAAAALKSHPWEGQHHDGYADSIESMLYLLPWFDIPECHLWVDEEIGVMFNKQSPSGFISNTYLDGNFIRTSLLYASYKTQGAMISRWRKDVKLGAAYDKNQKELYIYLDADSKWKGHIKFGIPRHKTIWNLLTDYPRLNSTPEWYIIEPERNYNIIDIETGEKVIQRGKALVEGIPINLNRKNSPVFLKISIVPLTAIERSNTK